jgi:hypothetical protein
VDFEKIENANRTANGRLRVYEVANKHTLSLSWELLPSQAEYTVDGYAGGLELLDMYRSGGYKNIEIWIDLSASKSLSTPAFSFDGRINSFNYSVEKRNIAGEFYDFWNVSMSVQEL